MRVECIQMASRTKRTRVRKNKTKRRSFRRVKRGGKDGKKIIDLSRGEASPEEIKGENDAKKELNDHDIFNKTHSYEHIIKEVNILMNAKKNEKNNSYSTEYMKGYMNKMEQIKRDYEKGRFTQVTDYEEHL